MIKMEKFIAPGRWFSMRYPALWNEFEDSADTFLFYDPNKWTGSFRISAFRSSSNDSESLYFGENSFSYELEHNPKSISVLIGDYQCAYSKEYFNQSGNNYVTHFWITGKQNTCLECSFTTVPDGNIQAAKDIISSIEIRMEGKKYPAEIIPVRLSEIYQIDNAVQWITNLVQKEFNVNFQVQEEDLIHLQNVASEVKFSMKDFDSWTNISITLCDIIVNEVEGMKWRTLVDGDREIPVIVYNDNKIIEPIKSVWNRAEKEGSCNIVKIYEEIISSLE